MFGPFSKILQFRPFLVTLRQKVTSTTPLNIAKHIGIIEFCSKIGQLLLNKVVSLRCFHPPQYITYSYDFDQSVPDHFTQFFGSHSWYGLYMTQSTCARMPDSKIRKKIKKNHTVFIPLRPAGFIQDCKHFPAGFIGILLHTDAGSIRGRVLLEGGLNWNKYGTQYPAQYSG